MHRIIAGISAILFFAAAIEGCGGYSSMNPPPGAGTVPVSFSVKDNPPSGVTVLAFEIQITGASLNLMTSYSGGQSVPLISHPEDVELEHLQTDSALLANLNVPPGTYNSVTMTFANPEMTILNQTGSALTLGGQSCATQQVCEFSPALNQASVTVQTPTAPFPITLSANSPVALRMDFDVNASVQSNDLSITPTVNLKQLPAPSGMGGDDGDDTEMIGQITAIDPTHQTFTLQVGLMGTTSMIATNSNTEFDFDGSCPADNFSCLQMNQIVKVEVQQMSDGSLTATDVEIFAPPSMFLLRGTVAAINTTAGTFQIVVFDDGAFIPPTMSKVTLGIPLTIDVAPQATFSVDANGLTLPAGLNFASFSDLMVGQGVRIHPTALSSSGMPPTFTITTDQVQLVRSEVTGTISAINASGTPPTFTLGMLPPLFTNAGISSIQVDVLSATQFESDDSAVNVTGISNLSTNNLVSVGGLLFNTTGTPTLVAEKVDLRQ
ncbi:MAG TPA: DUF5666 domain-containing protein [Candidatus Acidoferrales bacterium]|nr:DUF5666 domain-containing protein [Candidatus Acidoferrales bacterium]